MALTTFGSIYTGSFPYVRLMSYSAFTNFAELFFANIFVTIYHSHMRFSPLKHSLTLLRVPGVNFDPEEQNALSEMTPGPMLGSILTPGTHLRDLYLHLYLHLRVKKQYHNFLLWGQKWPHEPLIRLKSD